MHAHFRRWLRPALGGLLALSLAACGQAPLGAEQVAQTQFDLAATIVAAGTPTRASQPSPSPAMPSARPATTPPATSGPNQVLANPATAATAQPTATPALDTTAPPTAVPPSLTAEATTVIPPSPTADAAAIPPSPTDAASATPAPPTATPSAAPPSPTATPTPAPAPPDDGQPTELSFTQLYSGASISGPILSERAKALDGRTVVMSGYMAPPLKPDLDFFVLTKTPMVYCPFCSTAADWPFDIVFVRLAGSRTVPSMVPSQAIRVTGTFSVGSATDPASGFVSMVRIYATSVEPIN